MDQKGPTNMKIDSLCKSVRLILSDVDGVLTDGGIVYDNEAIETKRFFARDGMGITLWRRAGYPFGIRTSRNSHIVKVRADELNVDIIRQGFEDKRPVAKEIIEQLELAPEQVCYIGDDLPDAPVIRLVGLGVAVSDAAEEVRQCADYVTHAPGGHGAVREIVEMILKSQHRWESLIQRYLGEDGA